MEPRSLYVHVPFCVRRCSYCDFAVEALRDPPVDAWLGAISKEMGLVSMREGWVAPLTLDTLYIGGGTPSILGVGAIAALLDRLAPFALLADGAEWTCEANPESFDLDLARDWRAAGVNRISLGAQTFDEQALRWMGRMHGPDGPSRAMRAAREAGFDNVSIDLIFGLPSRLQRDWRADLERVIDLAPEHVSLYGLTAEAEAPLGRWVGEGREKMIDEDDYADEYLLAHQMLTNAGYEHYEVSNFGLSGRRSRHNFAYWEGVPYVGLGPGAHAFHPPIRRWNVRSWTAYRDAVEAGRLPVAGEETIEPETGELERIWLGLRVSAGLGISAEQIDSVALLRQWEERGLAVYDGTTVRLTAEGWLLLDELAVDLQEARRIPGSNRHRPAIDGLRDLVQIGANSNPARQ